MEPTQSDRTEVIWARHMCRNGRCAGRVGGDPACLHQGAEGGSQRRILRTIRPSPRTRGRTRDRTACVLRHDTAPAPPRSKFGRATTPPHLQPCLVTQAHPRWGRHDLGGRNGGCYSCRRTDAPFAFWSVLTGRCCRLRFQLHHWMRAQSRCVRRQCRVRDSIGDHDLPQRLPHDVDMASLCWLFLGVASLPVCASETPEICIS